MAQSRKTRYKLNVTVTISKQTAMDRTGRHLSADDPETDDIYWQDDFQNERLSINEDVTLGGMDFADAMRTLVALHDTLNAMKVEHDPR